MAEATSDRSDVGGELDVLGGKTVAGMRGMYVHTHWAYKHPYCARTWTVEDWEGYAGALQRLGYDTILLWPGVETMPDPLTSSDEAALERMGAAVSLLKDRLGMRVYLTLCPNVAADSASAAAYTYETREFFHCDVRIDPADRMAIRELMDRRVEQLTPLSAADGIAVIDSDPAGYPGSTNEEFVELLLEHRRMLDRVRGGMELNYWMHVGWEAYCRFYETGEFAFGTRDEAIGVLDAIENAAPEPWALMTGAVQEEQGLADHPRALAFRYGIIEGEPSFPLTGMREQEVLVSGAKPGPRGVMGNAQTHCVQLPNTLAFVRGARGLRTGSREYVGFADRLLPGLGERIARGWAALAGSDTGAMHREAEELRSVQDTPPPRGDLGGLLFGDGRRFLSDLVRQLEFRAAAEELCGAVDRGTGHGAELAEVAQTLAAWQGAHGYRCAFTLWRLRDALDRVGSPEVRAALNPRADAFSSYREGGGETPFECVHHTLRMLERQSACIVKALSAST